MVRPIEAWNKLQRESVNLLPPGVLQHSILGRTTG